MSEYHLQYQQQSEQVQEQQLQHENQHDGWMLGDDYCVSDRCKLLKQNTQRFKKNSAPLSDLRILSLNDIYLFDKDLSRSITKYFGAQVHQSIMSDLGFESYLPERCEKGLHWCMDVSETPPVDWLSSLSLGAKFLSEATANNNLLDIHTAHVLTQILPLFVSGSPDCSIEDSYVHHYLSPMLQSVFSSDPRFQIQWANIELKSNETKVYKPNLVVSSMCVNVKCIVVIAEFKSPNQTSAMESDLVKLGRQMRIIYNDLVASGVPSPVVCGL